MPLENNPTIPEELNELWPLLDDPVGQGDDHIRNIKTVLKALSNIYNRHITIANLTLGQVSPGILVFVTDRDNWPFLVTAGGAPDGVKILDAGNGNTAVLQTINGVYPSTAIGTAFAGILTWYNDSDVIIKEEIDGSIPGSAQRFATPVIIGNEFNAPSAGNFPLKGASAFSIICTEVDNPLPVSFQIYDAGASLHVTGLFEVTVTVVTSGGSTGIKQFYASYDGITITPVDILNTLPVEFTASISKSGTALLLDLAYAGGLGTGYVLSVSMKSTVSAL